jgi:hypothetical protein
MQPSSCDPAPSQFHSLTLAKANGTVIITARWQWDGVSVLPACNGPLVDVRLQNAGTKPWVVQLPHGRLAKQRTVAPGTDQTFNAGQLAAIGLQTQTDLNELTMILA